MIVAYIGNFVPEHSTENHVRQAWEHQGHTVIRVQEGEASEWDRLQEKIKNVDLVFWTRTADLAAKVGHRKQWEMLAAAKYEGVPTVAFHLDRWWGLDREPMLWEEPFFRCQHVITADGGHQAQFASIGVNHVWLPPAVSLAETELGTPQDQFKSPLAFVGSWQPGYHAEWTHRPELVQFLQQNYRGKIRFWPERNQPSVRGETLRNLYASVDLVIGDSCLVGGATHYWSDRIPETIGRGGLLIHPYVVGLEDHFSFYYNGVHMGEGSVESQLLTWEVGNWDQLKDNIDTTLSADPEFRRGIANVGRNHVRKHHTYDVRVNQILRIAGLGEHVAPE